MSEYRASYLDGTEYVVDIHDGKAVTIYVMVGDKKKVARRIPSARWRWLAEWIDKLLRKVESPTSWEG